MENRRHPATVSSIKRKTLLVGCAGFVLSLSGIPAYANPDGPDIIGGSITIGGLGTSQVDITQSSARGSINWDSFSIGNGETTRFIQPDSNSITLNRVTGGDPSRILGTMTANGKIILINGNGILFGTGSKVDAAGLVATTHDVDNDSFMSGAPMHFTAGAHEAANASVVNEGQITIHDAGVAAFVAPYVRNGGLIQADLGKVSLGSGNSFTLDLYGDDLVSFQVNDQIAQTLTAADGTPLRALIENDGLIRASGGKVVLTAATAREVVNQAVHVTGTIVADSVSQKGGTIILGGGDNGAVNVDHATLSAKGKKGGDIQVLGNQVTVSVSTLDASGNEGGGTVRVGGGDHGGEGLQRAGVTIFEAGSLAKADATVDGDGGSVVIWSDQGTDFGGTISARGEGAGNGGSSEISSAGLLSFHGTADLRATNGATGTLLLDPENITISTAATSLLSCSAGACTPSGDNSILNVTDLQNALGTSNVLVTTGATGAQAGTITVANSFTWANSNLLTLSAAAGIAINSGAVISNTYTGTYTAGRIPVVLALRADNAGVNNSSSIVNSGTINMSGSSGAVSMFYDATGTYTAGTQIANGSWVTPTDSSVSAQFTVYKLVNNVTDLAGMTLSGTYALGQNIAGGGAAFNSNAPLGVFSGILDGQYGKLLGGSNYTVTGLTLTTAANTANVGLFGSITGKVRNLGVGLTVIATGSTATASYNGILAGINNGGTIANVTSSGSIIYNFTGGTTIAGATSVGGLVGQNTSTGTIVNAANSAAVTYSQNGTTTGTSAAQVGGLVGQNSSTSVISISGSSSSGAVAGQYGSGTSKTTGNIGGLVGLANSATIITNSTSSGAVASSLITGASEYVGGLVGNLSLSGASITSSGATGTVGYTGAGTVGASVGGLVGNMVAGTSITGSQTSAGTVTNAGTIAGNAGGLVGLATGGSITTASSTSAVNYTGNGAGSVGGLVGNNAAANIITNSNAGGNVSYSGTGVGTVGGLVGTNTGTVRGTGGLYSYSTGTPSVGASSGASFLGGLIGNNIGTVLQAYSNGVILTYSGRVNTSIGGLIGTNSGTVGDSTAVTATTSSNNTVTVTATPNAALAPTYNVGGLIGANATGVGSKVYNAAATGNVTFNYSGTSTGTSIAQIGGLIGSNLSTATTSVTNASYAGNVLTQYSPTFTGTVTNYIGGLIGLVGSATEVTGSTSSGTVANSLNGSTTTEYTGGLIGYLNSATGTVTNSNSSSTTSYTGGGTPSIGGLIGYNKGIVQGGSFATGGVSVGSAATTSVNMGGLIGLHSGTVKNSYSANGTITYTGALTADIGGLIGQSTGTIGDSAASSATTYSNTAIVVNANPTAAAAITYSAGNLVGLSGTTGIIVNTTTGGNVTFNYAGNSTGTTTAQIGGLVGQSSSTNAAAITLSTSLNTVTAQLTPTFTGVITGNIGGLVGNASGTGTMNNVSSTATVIDTLSSTGTQNVGGLVGINAGVVKNATSTNGTITITTPGSANIGGLIGSNTGTIGDSAAVTATTFSNTSIIVNGTPALVTTPTYNIGNLAGSTSGTIVNTKTGGDVTFNYKGTTTSGTTTVQIGGLVGVNSSTSATSITSSVASNTVTAQVDAAATGAKILTGYVGGIEGLGSGAGGVISGVSSSATILSSVANGVEYVGGLAGYISAATAGITNSFATGSVTYNGGTASSVGGLVGHNKGIIQGTGATYTYATGAVNVSGITTGTTNIGGLAGLNNLTIKQAYSSNGTITYTGGGTINMGGLVGQSTAGVIGDAAASSATTYSNTALILNATPGATATYTEGNLVGLLSGATGAVINVTTGADVAFNYGGTAGANTAYIGGLIGQNSSTAATSASFATATNNVLANYTPTFSGAVTLSAGGFAGYLTGATIMSSISATGSVGSDLAGTLISMGGLVGTTAAAGSTITNSFATGNVDYTGVGATAINLGGLTGKNQGIIQGSGAGSYSYATGDVKATNVSTNTGITVNIGGLAGTSNAMVKQAYSQGGVVQYTGAAATANVGGLVGQLTAGTIGDASATTQTTSTNENVTATITPTGAQVTTVSVGGLVGSIATVATGNIIYSKSTGDVNYLYQGNSSVANNAYIGGIIGSQTNTVATSLSSSYALGNVSALYAPTFTGSVNTAIGGAVGYINSLTARQGIWASGSVTEGLDTGTQYIGGLIGANNSTGATTDSYSVGAVSYTGSSAFAEGGLIGYNKGNVGQSYSTGYVMNTGSATVHGLIGNNVSGTITDGYWDTGTSGQTTAYAGTGVATTTLQNALLGAFSGTTWGIVSGETNPYLKWQIASGSPQVISGFAYSDLGITALGNAGVGALDNGVAISSILTKDGNAITGANGYYYFLVAPSTMPTSNGKVMTYLTGATKANTVIDTANKVDGSATGLDLYATYLHEYSASTTISGMLAGLGTALGSNTGANYLYTFSGGVPTLKAGANIAVDGTGASLSINQALSSPGGSVYIRNNGAVTQTAAITATNLALAGAGATYTLTNASNAVGNLAANTGSINLNNTGALAVDTIGGIVGVTGTGAVQIVDTAGITLNQGITSGATGNSILLAGTGFTNNVGAAALNAGAGYFRVWSGDPSADSRGSIAYDYKQYNATYGTTTVLGTGNGFLYTTAPVLSNTITNVTKVYDGATAVSFTGASQSVGGAIDGDTAVLSISGASANYADKNAGTGKAIGAVSGVTITSTTNGAATVYGYQLAQPLSASGDINKADLSITGASAADKIYDSTTAAILGGTAALSGQVAGDTVTLATGGATGTFSDKNVGTGKTVTTSGYTISGADSGNYNLTQPTGLTATITQAALTLSGLSANNKIYDTNTSATLIGTAALSGKFAGDTVTIGGTGAGAFADKNVGNGKAVTVTGYSISGTDAGNYAFAQPTGITADITSAALTLSGLSAADKTYDALTAATLTGTAALSGTLGSDLVTIDGTGAGAFVDKNVANGKVVTVTGYTVSGTDAGNYTFTQPTGLTANITQAALTLSGLSASNKIYDSTALATLTGTAALSGKLGSDVVTIGGSGAGAFADKNVANGKAVIVTGYTVSGTDAGNYSFTQPAGLSASITPASLNITGVSVVDKIYDSTAIAILTGTAALSGKFSGDTVNLGGAGAGAFADKNVANGKSIGVTGYTVSGVDAGNYTLAQPAGLTANITPAALTLSGLSASNKVYDTLTTATLTGTAALSGKLGSDVVSIGGAGAGAFADKNVGNGKAVTVTGYTVSGADAGNYSFTQPAGLSANITAASLNITGLGASNKIYDATTLAILTGTAALSGTLGSDVVTLGGTGTGTFADKNVANGKAVIVTGYSVGGTDAGNYSLSQPTGLSANVTPASLGITGVTASDKVYDALLTDTLIGTAALSGKFAGDTVNLGGAGAGAFADKNVGIGKSVSVTGYTISGTDAGNYIFNQPTGLSATITAASLNVTNLSANNKVYDGTMTGSVSGTAALLGKKAGDVVTVSGAGASYNFDDKNVGSGKALNVAGYTITGTDAGNYIVSQPVGLIADITPATLTLNGISALDKIYDAIAAATLNGTAALNGKIGGDTVTLSAVGATASFANKNAGAGKAVTVTGYSVSGADAGNYTLTQPTGLTASITQAALTLSGMSANNKVYDSTATATLIGTATLAGKFSGDTVTLGGTGAGAFSNKNVGNSKTVGVTGYSISGTDAGNYAFTQPAGLTADITPAALTLSGLSGSNKVYDALTIATLTGTAALSGKFAGDIVAIGGTGTGVFADKNVANGKSVTVTGYTVSGTDAGNYTFVQPTGLTANITPAALTLSGLSASDKIYDTLTTATITGTAALSGKLGSDILTISGTGAGSFADKNVANGKSVTVTGYTVSGVDAGNYTFAQPTGLTANITPAALTLSGLNALDKVYDATTLAALTGTATLSGKLGSDIVTIGGTGAGAFTDKNVANSKNVTVTGYTVSGIDAGNYLFTQPTGLTANITPASLFVTGLSGVNRIYDATTVAGLNGTAALSGGFAGDAISLSGAAAGSFVDKNAGTGKSILVTGYTVSGSDAGNYSLAQPTGLSANITPAALSIAGLTGVDKVYDTTTLAGLAGSASLSGMISGDTVNLSGTAAAAFADKNVGAAKLIAVSGYNISGIDAGNYSLSQPTGITATITPANLGIAGLSANNRVYDSTTAGTLSGTALLQGVMGSDTVSLGGTISSVFADKNVGVGKAVAVGGYTISGLDAGNYSLAQPSSMTANITAASLTINGVSIGNKVYDATTGATLAGTAALQGLFSGDLINLSTGGATASYGDKNVGTGKAVSVSGYDITGTDAGNYTLAQPAGLTGNITPSSLTVTGIAVADKVYDATTLAALSGTAALSGLMAGDNVALGGTATAAFNNKNVGTAKPVTVVGYNITGGDGANYIFSQPVGLSASIITATLGITGVSAQDKVYDGTTAATLVTAATSLQGNFAGDAVTLVTGSVSGAFATKTAGTGKTVLVSGFSIAGTDAANYALLPAGSVTANIGTRSLNIGGSFTANSKPYDGTDIASLLSNTLVLGGILGGDVVTLTPSLSFADANVGSNKIVSIAAGSVLAGGDSGNYSLSLTGSPTALADIISNAPPVSAATTQTTTAIFNTQPIFAAVNTNIPNSFAPVATPVFEITMTTPTTAGAATQSSGPPADAGNTTTPESKKTSDSSESSGSTGEPEKSDKSPKDDSKCKDGDKSCEQ